MRHTADTARKARVEHSVLDRALSPIHLIVLDDDERLLRAIEDSLWMWPRDVYCAAHIEDAISQCRNCSPTAILIAIDRNVMREQKALPALRRRLPKIPIVAIVSADQASTPAPYLEHGADALLLREDAHRPMLYGLLQRIQHRQTATDATPSAQAPRLEAPWANSQLLRTLICDYSGTIVDANRALARQLHYENCAALRDRNVRRDLLDNVEDWNSWGEVAFDSTTICQRDVPIRTADRQVVTAEIEIFAVPDKRQFIQAVFVCVSNSAGQQASES